MKCQDISKNNEVCRKPYGSQEVQFGIRKMCGLFSFISVSAPPMGGGCLFKPVSYVSYKFSSISTKRFPSALSYFLAINPPLHCRRTPRVRLPAASWIAKQKRSAYFICSWAHSERLSASRFRSSGIARAVTCGQEIETHR